MSKDYKPVPVCLCRPWRHLRLAMRRGRHRVENRVGEVQARGGAGRGGVGWGGGVMYFADRIVPQYKSRSYSPENSVSVCGLFYSCDLQIAVRMEFAIDDLLTL